MSLIASISGIRGTIGGKPGEGLSPVDVVNFTSAYASMLLKQGKQKKVVIGRDARISGKMVSQLVSATLQGMGIDVVDLGLSTTPTVEIAVPREKAGGGIILTASHNPKEWNALKLLNEKGEFISKEEGADLLQMIEKGDFDFADVDSLGSYEENNGYIQEHIDLILEHPLVDVNAIKAQDYEVAIDCVNSTGGISVLPLLHALGVKKVHELNCEPDGHFPHNPEPLPKHLGDLSKVVAETDSVLGISVDPDVDRLVFINEDGSFFGEEYTLVALADYFLQHKPGSTVSNLSSTKALRDVTEGYGQKYFASAVGEVNVVKSMKAENAVIGGEGNGGIIIPELHYGRDALAGIALFLSFMAKSKQLPGDIKKKYPLYYMGKNKVSLEAGMDVDGLLAEIHSRYSDRETIDIDGVKIYFEDEWVHLRKSNTEPIIRIYTESTSQEKADALGQAFITELTDLAKVS